MTLPFCTRTIIANGFSTRYLEAGTDNNPTLILLHDGGFGSTAQNCWEGVIRQLSDRYHILAPELLGWGGTDKAVFFDRSPYAGRIPHIAAFLQAKGVRQALFAGASFGGSLLMQALAMADTPWGVRRAISISGSGGPYRLPSGIEALADYTPSLEAARKLTQLIVGDAPGLEAHIQDRHENSLIPGHWEALMAPRLRNPSASQRPPAQDAYLDALRQIRVPVLLVAGRRDPLLEAGWAGKLAALNPDFFSHLELNGGHEPNISQPAEVAEVFHEFFKQEAAHAV